MGNTVCTKVSKEGRSLPRVAITLYTLDWRVASKGYGNDNTTIQEWLLIRSQHLRDAQTDGLHDTLSQVAVANGQAEGHPVLLTIVRRLGISSISSILATGTRISLGIGQR
jgi:hypothetical protein